MTVGRPRKRGGDDVVFVPELDDSAEYEPDNDQSEQDLEGLLFDRMAQDFDDADVDDDDIISRRRHLADVEAKAKENRMLADILQSAYDSYMVDQQPRYFKCVWHHSSFDFL